VRVERTADRLAPPPPGGGAARAEPARPSDGLVPGTLWLAEGGALRCRTPHSLHVLPPTLALWVPQATPHQAEALGGARLRRIELPLAQDVVGPNPAIARVALATPLLAALADTLDGACGDPPHAARRGLALALARDELQGAEALAIGIALPRSALLRRACDAALHEDAGDDLQTLARVAGTSVRTLARAFRQEFDLSFGHWRLRVRLARLVALWAEGRTLGASAAAVGYGSPSALSFMVRRLVGMTPSRLLSSRPGAAREREREPAASRASARRPAPVARGPEREATCRQGGRARI
jgi:AraC-like DNA-binding protein